ncbi:MAG: pentapeptide repeat-containing protein, partial [Microcoleus sp.]
MTPESNSSQPNPPESNVTVENLNGASPALSPEPATIVATAEPKKPLPPPPSRKVFEPLQPPQTATEMSASLLILGSIAAMIIGLAIDIVWLGLLGAILAIAIALRIMWPNWGKIWTQVIPPTWRTLIVSSFGLLAGTVGLLILSGANGELGSRNIKINWDAVGAVGEVIGALGQILIAILGVYVAWRQYVISKDLTIQQNRITQQQTIDAYFQGVSDLALDEQGFLEDWPQERAIAEGRTAAIMSSVDAEGKAKILRFLSQSRLVTPLKRDRLLGRAILDGDG